MVSADANLPASGLLCSKTDRAMATIIITGGTGMLGTAIRKQLLTEGHELIIYTRHPKPTGDVRERMAFWDPADGKMDEEPLRQADAIIHLAGAGVADKRWTRKRKEEIVNSRVQSGQLLVETLARVRHRVRTLVSASAIGWYGPDPVIPNPNPFSETDPAHPDFLGSTCQAWEQAISPVVEQGCRLVILRIGIVLSNTGGALKEFRKPVKFGLATVMGSGRQIISWIHIDDLVRLFIESIGQEKMSGVYNAVATHPVSNREFFKTLAREEKGNLFMMVPVPAFVLKLMLGEMSVEILKSTTVSNQKLRDAGFYFQWGSLKDTLHDLHHQ